MCNIVVDNFHRVALHVVIVVSINVGETGVSIAHATRVMPTVYAKLQMHICMGTSSITTCIVDFGDVLSIAVSNSIDGAIYC